MSQHIKSILLLASILALLVSARDAQSLDALGHAGAPGVELPSGAQIGPTPTPEGGIGDTDQVITIESFQTPVAPTGPEVLGSVDPKDIPSAEELDAILDRVNRGGPERSGSDQVVGEGPVPGMESVIEPVNASSPEGIPGGTVNQEGPDCTERVNQGEPELPASDEGAGKEPQPETESGTEQRFSLDWILIRFIETLRTWWHEFLS